MVLVVWAKDYTMSLTTAPDLKPTSKNWCKRSKQKRIVSANMITYDKYEILNDPEIDVVVELIDDATEAFEIVKTAITNGKHVVTANKKCLPCI